MPSARMCACIAQFKGERTEVTVRSNKLRFGSEQRLPWDKLAPGAASKMADRLTVASSVGLPEWGPSNSPTGVVEEKSDTVEQCYVSLQLVSQITNVLLLFFTHHSF